MLEGHAFMAQQCSAIAFTSDSIGVHRTKVRTPFLKTRAGYIILTTPLRNKRAKVARDHLIDERNQIAEDRPETMQQTFSACGGRYHQIHSRRIGISGRSAAGMG